MDGGRMDGGRMDGGRMDGGRMDGGDGGEGDPCSATFGVPCAVFEEAYLKASNTDSGDAFGLSVALDGDTLAVGGVLEDSSATGVDGDEADNSAALSGAVYIFTRSGTTWSQQAYLKASNTDAADQFGVSVSLDGDTLAVGAAGEDGSANSAAQSGAVYIFTRSGTTWSQQAYLKASNTDADDQFGFSVSLDSDTLVVGAMDESSSATGIDGDGADNGRIRSGAVYVFTRSGTTWSQQAYLKASNTDVNDQFGWSVSLDSDTLVVGAPGESSIATGIDGNGADNSANRSGAVYVFTRSGTTWSQQAYLKASNTDARDEFGSSVTLDSDTLAVGARFEGSGAAEDGNGAVYVFMRSGTTWSQQAHVRASNAEAGDRFGSSVSLDNDTLVVGATTESSSAIGIDGDGADNSASGSGSVYVFTRSGATWSQQAYLKASNTDANDLFGSSVSLDSDTLVVGAPGESSSGTGVDSEQADDNAPVAGAVYVRRISP